MMQVLPALLLVVVQLVALNDAAQAGDAGWMLAIAGLVGGLADQPPEPFVSHTPSGIGRCTEPADANVWWL